MTDKQKNSPDSKGEKFIETQEDAIRIEFQKASKNLKEFPEAFAGIQDIFTRLQKIKGWINSPQWGVFLEELRVTNMVFSLIGWKAATLAANDEKFRSAA